jgi:hypothetical protein
MRPETERIRGRRMQQEDIGNLKKSTKAKLSERGHLMAQGIW